MLLTVTIRVKSIPQEATLEPVTVQEENGKMVGPVDRRINDGTMGDIEGRTAKDEAMREDRKIDGREAKEDEGLKGEKQTGLGDERTGVTSHRNVWEVTMNDQSIRIADITVSDKIVTQQDLMGQRVKERAAQGMLGRNEARRDRERSVTRGV